MKRTVIIGLGNPLLADDSAGILAARLLRRRLENHPEYTVIELPAGGMRLLDAIAGFDEAVIVDAVAPGAGRPGTIHRLSPADLGESWNSTGLHDMDLPTALALGRMLGMQIPGHVVIWGVTGEDMETFSEQPTAAVARAIPELVQHVCAGLETTSQQRQGEPL